MDLNAFAALDAAVVAAQAALDAAKTPENWNAYKAAWNARAAWNQANRPVKPRGFASRAGQRQRRELLAQMSRRR